MLEYKNIFIPIVENTEELIVDSRVDKDSGIWKISELVRCDGVEHAMEFKLTAYEDFERTYSVVGRKSSVG